MSVLQKTQLTPVSAPAEAALNSVPFFTNLEGSSIVVLKIVMWAVLLGGSVTLIYGGVKIYFNASTFLTKGAASLGALLAGSLKIAPKPTDFSTELRSSTLDPCLGTLTISPDVGSVTGAITYVANSLVESANLADPTAMTAGFTLLLTQQLLDNLLRKHYLETVGSQLVGFDKPNEVILECPVSSSVFEDLEEGSEELQTQSQRLLDDATSSDGFNLESLIKYV